MAGTAEDGCDEGHALISALHDRCSTRYLADGANLCDRAEACPIRVAVTMMFNITHRQDTRGKTVQAGEIKQVRGNA